MVHRWAAGLLLCRQIPECAFRESFRPVMVSSSPQMIYPPSDLRSPADSPRKVMFFPFPFPELDDCGRAEIGALGEKIDAHRKRQQCLHEELDTRGSAFSNPSTSAPITR